MRTELRFGQGVLEPGQELYSDTVRALIEPGTELTIDLYLPGRVSLKTFHVWSMRTSEVSASGNFTGAVFTPVARINSWYLLCGVDIEVAEGGSLVAFGDSITDGVGSVLNRNHRWPDYLAARLRKTGIAVVNAGIGFNRILHDQPSPLQPSISALKRFVADALEVPGSSYVVVLVGINDIALTSSFADPKKVFKTLIDGYERLITLAHERDKKILLGTLTPFKGYGSFSPDREEMRQLVNSWIRGNTGADGFIDFDQTLRDPLDPERLAAIYDSGDHLHPGDRGYKAMAAAVPLSMLLN